MEVGKEAGHRLYYKITLLLWISFSIGFNSITNSKLQDGYDLLNNYNYVFWILGDESTVDETFNSTEQALVKDYLEKGGSFFCLW